MSEISPLHTPLLASQLTDKPLRFSWGNLWGASRGLALHSVIVRNKQLVVIITPDTRTAIRLQEELEFFNAIQDRLPIIHFPDWETLPYDPFSPHQDIVSSRLSALNTIPTLSQGAIIIPIATVMQRLAPRDFLDSAIFSLKKGDKLNINSARQRFEKAGYYCVEQVCRHGEFAVRGAIVDLFPMGCDLPYRLDLFDDEIDSIRTFSPDTQRSLEKVNYIALLPAKEFPLNEKAIELFRQQWRSQFNSHPLNCPIYNDMSEGICSPGIEYYLPLFFESQKTASLFDYLPQNSVMITIGDVHDKAVEFWKEIQERYEQRAHDITRPLLKPQQIFIPVPDVFSALQKYNTIKIQINPVATDKTHFNFATKAPLNLKVDHKASRPLQALEAFLINYAGRVLFCAETTGRREVLLQLLNNIQIQPVIFDSWEAFLFSDAKYGMTVAPLEEGLYLLEPPLAMITEAQLFGERIMQRRRRKETAQEIDAIVKDLTELHVGVPIVHINHGVGRYLGLKTLTVGEQVAEFLQLEYADGDKLYVPVASLHLISRYSGAEPENAPLHKLGTEQWQRAKQKAAEQVCDVAAELLDIYAKREARTGYACKLLDEQYAAFAAAFPFEETPDQQQAIDNVIRDMTSDKPMDRLVCGDVGFGKTEVAMRAAFIAVQNNKQVAVLVPTTLLAQQHYQNFQNRFADWPIHIAVMSRFHSGSEQKTILEKLAQGKIDIVIGTHKLLQANIQFKELGLVIIDEEHRFGVSQKERLKALRVNVDILTLTATPIPRTLNMAFAGIRDLSLIATPPARRLSIKTFIQEKNNALIQEALLREIMRGGQVYFVHNEIESIEKIGSELTQLLPEARVGIAHGQMEGHQLEQIMADFYHRRFNVLVCTTIIESGIDVPSANTIIINRADKFGLAQLHQLRGRVGRSHHQAYAYLLIPSRKMLTPDATKRLDAIGSLEDLGIGFTLATHDLEIRGAGELLGKNQSGQMHAIGFTLYMDLLSRAVTALKSGNKPELDSATLSGTEVDLQIPALIPESYLGDVHLRLQCYKRIASAKTVNELDEIQVEMIDRFGLLPPQAKNLFSINMLKQHAEKLGILKIEANSKNGKFEFTDQPAIEPMRLIKLIQTQSQQFRLDGSKRLRFTLPEHTPFDRIGLIEKILEELE
ncbi:MAG: transcription-repair coupling factor [Gammaproteobacteria bacterium]|jgi:transcription-repair coupling factor (superfamily II helicase)|nr:transcription-repair coupling factor [Gammaproteobacteria bacterium]